MLAKFHIYKKKIPPNFQAFLSLLKEKRRIEKHKAFNSNVIKGFFLSLLGAADVLSNSRRPLRAEQVTSSGTVLLAF